MSKSIVDDLNTAATGGEVAEDLCIWALRAIPSICGASSKLQQFFLKQKRAIEVIVKNTKIYH